MHLSGKADAGDGRRIDAVLRQNTADRGNCGVPPIVRLLFGPSVFRLIQRIFDRRRGNCCAGGIEQDGFRAGGADIDAKKV